MLVPSERAAIVSAIRDWAGRVPDVPVFGFLQDEQLMTPTQVREAVEKESPEGRAILQIIEHNLRRSSLQTVVNTIRTLPAKELRAR